MSIRVTVWGEYRHEKKHPKVAEVYPRTMHETIADALRRSADLQVRTAWLDQDENHGLSDDVLQSTDVLTWWGHMAHNDVKDEVVTRVHKRVLEGMGLLVLHSGHVSKIFRALMGTSCMLKWREANDREILWVTRPGHPCVAGIDDHFILPQEEMYGEFFDIPEPDCTFLISTFTGGECIRSGCVWNRGAARVIYFRPGHETHPTYHDPNVQRIIENCVRYAAKTTNPAGHTFGHRKMGWIDQPK